jgi:hypothetical protein
MARKKAPVPFTLRDRVQIRQSGDLRGRIVELRSPLGPGGTQINRFCVRRKPTPAYIEVREDQLLLLPAEA